MKDGRIGIHAILGEAFPTLDLTDPEDVRALARTIRENPEEVEAAVKRLLAKAQQVAGEHEPRPE